MKPEAYSTVHFHFSNCEAGWITMKVLAEGVTTHISLTQVFDPFQNMLYWIEALLSNVQECAFEIDEERTSKRFEAIRRRQNRFLFRIRDCAGEVLIQVVAHRYHFIKSLYREVQTFAKSADYKPKEWENESLGDRLITWMKLRSFEAVLDDLLPLRASEIQKLFFSVAPGYNLTVPTASDDDEQFAILVDHLLDPSKEKNGKEIVETPSEWLLDDNYDGWSANGKREYLDKYCQENSVSGYTAMPLSRFRTQQIENYLSTADSTDE